MTFARNDAVLQEALWPTDGTMLWVKRAVLVAFGIALLALTAKIKVMIPPSPVPITLTTFGVLLIGTAYGPRLGFATIAGFLLVGLMGFDVFANSSAEKAGWVYMSGGTGGYLVGYAVAAAVLGWFARKGWDRNVGLMALGMFVGNLAIYVPGLLWLNTFAENWAQTFEWGLTPFLIGDAMKLGLAALLVPALWKLVGSART